MTDFVTINVGEDDSVPKLAAYPIAISDDSKFKISAFCKGKGKKRKFLLQSDHHGLPFEAHDNSSQNFCKYAVGLFDEKTNEIELLPCHHVFVMEKASADQDADFDEDLMSPLSHQQRKASLTEAFGSKKKKRAMRAMESNTISADSISGASSISQMIVTSNESLESPKMSNKDSNIGGESAAKNALQAQREIMLPPHDVTASTLSGAYPLTDLIPGNVHHAIKEWIASIAAGFSDCSPDDKDGIDSSLVSQNAEWLEKMRQDRSPEFVVNMFSEAFSQHRSKVKDLKRKLGLLLLFDVQLKFCKCIIDARRQIDKDEFQKMLAHPPSEVFRHLTNSFAVYRKSAGKAAFTTTKAHM
jgi:hypothetical protein